MPSDFDKAIEAMFGEFDEQGITTAEVVAAGACLKRERGNEQDFTVTDVVRWLCEYVIWRRVIRAHKEGDLKIEYRLTEQGARNAELSFQINNIFKKEGK